MLIDYLETELKRIVIILLPKLTQNKEVDVDSFVKLVVGTAVDLKMKMDQDLAPYRCFWVDRHQKYDSFSADNLDPEAANAPGRTIFLCTFAGIQRADNEKGFRRVVVQKASVVLH